MNTLDELTEMVRKELAAIDRWEARNPERRAKSAKRQREHALSVLNRRIAEGR